MSISIGFWNLGNSYSVYIRTGCIRNMKDSPTDYKTVHWTVLYPPFGRAVLSSPSADKKYGIGKSLPHIFGTPEGTRTPDLLIRSQSLYPTELPAHTTHSSMRPNIVAHHALKCKCFFHFFGNIFYHPFFYHHLGLVFFFR